MSCGVGLRRGSDPVLLWLWCRPTSVAAIWPLDWECPYAAGVALKSKKKKKKGKEKKKEWWRTDHFCLAQCSHWVKLWAEALCTWPVSLLGEDSVGMWNFWARSHKTTIFLWAYLHFGLYFPSLASKENPSLYATLCCPFSKKQQSPNLSKHLSLEGLNFSPLLQAFSKTIADPSQGKFSFS